LRGKDEGVDATHPDEYNSCTRTYFADAGDPRLHDIPEVVH